MLSENLDALSMHLGKYSDSGVEMDALAVTSICALISTMAEDARRLEAVITPARDLPKGVVSLVGRQRRRTSPITTGGGDAA